MNAEPAIPSTSTTSVKSDPAQTAIPGQPSQLMI
jgi:hypothetical protein